MAGKGIKDKKINKKKSGQYTTISYLSVQQFKLSPRGDVDDPMALLHEAEGRGQQCIGSSAAPRV